MNYKIGNSETKMEVESINYPIITSSSPVTDSLPSPNLTESSHSSPKGSSLVFINNSKPHLTVETKNQVQFQAQTQTQTQYTNTNTNNTVYNSNNGLSAMLRSISKSKELNITEYTNRELKSLKKRCRTVMTSSQCRVLNKVLEQTAFPSTEIRENLAKILGMKPRTVQIWFQNQRQKSRQVIVRPGDSPEEIKVNLGSPEGNFSSSNSGVTVKSPFESGASNDAIRTPSPNFTALTAAAFALAARNSTSITPLDGVSKNYNPVTDQQQQQQQQQRYSTFHGAVYKSTPGCLPINPSSYRGNTAAAINNKRIGVANGNNVFMPGSSQPGFVLPPQPQKIPAFPPSQFNNNGYVQQQRVGTGVGSGDSLPLDILASAVSNFRPNGYNYFPQPQSQSQMISPINHINYNYNSSNSDTNSNAHSNTNNSITNSLSQIPRNRLAPLRTVSNSTSNSPLVSPDSAEKIKSFKLPSLKDLAQVASCSLGRELNASIKVESSVSSLSADHLHLISSSITTSSNTLAPNAHNCNRRPW